mgnify:CR=1 FL=1
MKIILLCLLLLVIPSVFAQQWVSQESGTNQNLQSVYFVSQASGWAVGGIGLGGGSATILKTNNSGETWVSRPIPSGINSVDVLNDVCFNSGHGIIVGTGGKVLFSEDSGSSWSLGESSTGENIYGVDCLDATHAVAVAPSTITPPATYHSAIMKTYNGGETWESKYGADGLALYDVYFANSLVGWAVGDQGTQGVILKTINGGETWNPQGSNLLAGLSGIHCLNVDECWVVGSGGSPFYKTTDGENWDPVLATGLNDRMTDIYLINSTKGFIAAQNALLETLTPDTEWNFADTDISTGTGLLPVAYMRKITCPSRTICWAVGDSGTILRWGEPRYGQLMPPPNQTYYIPNQTEPEENRTIPEPNPEVECPAFMDDCEAGYYPLPEYDSKGCAVDYTCIQEGTISLDYLSSFIGQVPGLGQNEQINVYVTRKDGIIKEWGVILEKGEIKEIRHVQLNKPTLIVRISETTVQKIMDSENSVGTAIKAYKNGEISIESKTFSGKIKLAFVKIFSWFK